MSDLLAVLLRQRLCRLAHFRIPMHADRSFDAQMELVREAIEDGEAKQSEG